MSSFYISQLKEKPAPNCFFNYDNDKNNYNGPNSKQTGENKDY